MGLKIIASTIRRRRWRRAAVVPVPRMTLVVTTFSSNGLMRPIPDVTRISTATKVTCRR
jgi:hypothetical protein